VVVSCFESGESMLLTNVYVPIDFPSKVFLWSKIIFIHSLVSSLPWILVGEFNSIVILNEKSGAI